MRRLMLILFVMFSLVGFLMAQTEPLSVSFTPPSISLNVLNAAAFDPINPGSQPFLTNLRIINNTSNPLDFTLSLSIKWNNTGSPLVNVTFPSLNPIGAGEQWNLSNRDLITDQASTYFNEPSGEISLEGVMNSNPILKSALESGNFPDGTLNFYVTVAPRNKQLRSSSATFVISVTNISSIFPTYPGKPIGQSAPKVNMKPVTFLWSAMTTNINTFRLTIKEFVPGNPPDANSVETSGRIVFDSNVGNNMFDDYLPFQSNHYYAWQVKTPLFTEHNFPGTGNPPNILLKSQWFVFMFDESQSGNDTSNQEFTAILNMFNDPLIRDHFNAGYTPTGVVIYEGRVYTGQDAIDLINALVGKALQIEIKEQ